MEDISSSVQNNDGNFNITLISAQNLPNVRTVFKDRVRIRAKVKVRGHEKTKWETEVDSENGLNPVWNCSASYNVSETGIMNKDLWIVIKLYSKRTFGDRIIGEVNISVKALFDKGESATLTYPVKQGNIDTGGAVNISYSFSVKKGDVWKKYIMAGAIILMKVATIAALGAI